LLTSDLQDEELGTGAKYTIRPSVSWSQRRSGSAGFNVDKGGCLEVQARCAGHRFGIGARLAGNRRLGRVQLDLERQWRGFLL
jgi:hypothetical protein